MGRNVAALSDLPSAETKQSKAMTLEQVGQLLGSDLELWWRAYVTVGVTYGLRPGELLGLRWRDADLSARVLRVRKALGANGELQDLKTERSKRTLAMPRPQSCGPCARSRRLTGSGWAPTTTTRT